MLIPLLLHCLLGVTVFSVPVLAQQTLEEEVRAAKIEEAAFRAVEESRGFLRNRLSPHEALANAILSNPTQHRSKSESERLVRDREREALKKAFREQLVRFAENRRDLPSGWVDNVMSKETERVDATVESLLGSQFGGTYMQARNLAVSVQRSELTDVLRPEPREVEELAGSKPTFLDKRLEDLPQITIQQGHPLVKKYFSRATQDRALLEENEADLEKRTASAVDEGLAQLWKQLKLVDRHDGRGAVELSSLKTNILQDVEQLAEREAEKSYGVFPLVRSAIDDRAKSLEVNLFNQFVREQLSFSGGCQALPKQRVLREAPESFNEVPAETDDHVKNLDKVFRSEIQNKIVNNYAAALEDRTTRQRFQEKLSRILAQEGRVASEFNVGFSSCLEAPLKEHREKLAASELAVKRKEVADLSHQFPDAALTRLFEKGEDTELSASEFPSEAGLRMEETKLAFLGKKARLISEGKEAVGKQIALVKERRDRYGDQIKKDQDRSNENQERWQKTYENEVLQEWRKERPRVLLSDKGKYDRVFQLASKEISDIITTEWKKAVQQPHQVVTQPIRTPPSQPVSSSEEETREVATGGPKLERGEGIGKGPGGGGGKDKGPGEDESGGGGGGSGRGCGDIVKAYASCLEASRICHEALAECRKSYGFFCSEANEQCKKAHEECLHLS